MLLSESLKSRVRLLDTFGRSLLAVFVPPLCVGCDSTLGPADRWLCAGCRVSLSANARPRSRTVALGGGRHLTVRYALDYGPVVSRIVTQMKYADKPGLAGFLAPFMNFAMSGPLPEETVVIPVPIHAAKRRERGYNQSELLAGRLAKQEGYTVQPDLLLKRKNTISQTALEKEDRMRNVVGSFALGRKWDLSLGSVLLVDDVVTTGSTLRECAKSILKLGVKEISACVVASSQ
jgi:ComF family protein